MQFQMPQNQPNPLRQYRGIFNGFLAGLVIGALLGWIFHGVVSLLVRFGLVLILLIPLILIGLLLWRSRRLAQRMESGQDQSSGMRVFTWPNDRRPEGLFGAGPHGSDEPSFRRAEPEQGTQPTPRRNRQEIIDLEFEELKRDVDGDKPS